MQKKKTKTAKTEQKKPANSASLAALARLLRRFAEDFESVSDDLAKAGIAEVSIRGRDGVDMFVKRLEGYLRNAKESAGRLSVGEMKNSYHVVTEEKPQQ